MYVYTFVIFHYFWKSRKLFRSHTYVYTYNILVTVFDSQLAIYDPSNVKKVYAQQKMIPR